MSLSGRPPTLPSYQNQFNNGLYVTAGPVVFPDASISSSAIANSSDADGYVTVATDQNITGQKRFIEQVLADSIQLSDGAAQDRVLTSDSLGNASWQDVTPPPDLLTSANIWTNTNKFNTFLPTSTQTPSQDAQLITRVYADSRYVRPGDSVAFAALSSNGLVTAAIQMNDFGAAASGKLLQCADSSGTAHWVTTPYLPTAADANITIVGTTSLTGIDLKWVSMLANPFTTTVTKALSATMWTGSYMFLDELTSIDWGNVNLLDQFQASLLVCTSIVGLNVTVLKGFVIVGNAATTFSFPLLTTVYGSSNFNLPVLTSLSLPLLAWIQGFTLNGPLMTTVNLPLLKETTQLVFTLPLVTTLTMTSLQRNNQGPNTIIAASLTTFSLPALVYSAGNFTLTCGNLVTFGMGNNLKLMGGTFSIAGAKLNQASVDGILVSLAALDGTNGTTAYSSKVVTLNGGTSATPSATGLAAKAVLVGRGCTVNNN